MNFGSIFVGEALGTGILVLLGACVVANVLLVIGFSPIPEGQR